jgi:hypothetical protein
VFARDTPHPLKWGGFWTNPSSEELSVQGCVPAEEPRRVLWFPLSLWLMFYGRAFPPQPATSSFQRVVMPLRGTQNS